MFAVSQVKFPAGHVTLERVSNQVLFFHIMNSPGQVQQAQNIPSWVSSER